MKIKKLNKQELIELVNKICNTYYNSEEECDEMCALFKYNVPDPEACDLIFHHDPELTPEEIVEKALSYKPIILGPTQNDKMKF
jgi:hypothetical protein